MGVHCRPYQPMDYNGLAIYEKKTPVLFLVMTSHVYRPLQNPYISSMSKTLRNILTKFGCYWPSSIWEKDFWKINDNNEFQVMGIPHTALIISKNNNHNVCNLCVFQTLKGFISLKCTMDKWLHVCSQKICMGQMLQDKF